MTVRDSEETHLAKRQKTIDDAESVRTTLQDGTGVEFEILQGYRDFDHEVNKDRVSIARNGDITIAVDRLKVVDKLFDKTSGLASNRNSLLAQDARAVLNISELAHLSVRNTKFDESKKLLGLEDILNSAKKYMLREFFQINSLTEELRTTGTDHLDEESNDLDESTENGNATANAVNGASEQDDLRQRENRRAHLQNFAKYDHFGQFNWFKMGALFKLKSRSPEIVDHILAPFALEKKKRAPVQRRLAETVGQASTAEVLTSNSLNSTQEKTTPEQVKKCYKVLLEKNGTDRINLFKFILDPNSFARSVENLFYTSFLIKEGKLVLEEDIDGYPSIRPKEGLPRDKHEREIEIQRRNVASQNHIIFQMNMATWRSLIEKFSIVEAFIP